MVYSIELTIHPKNFNIVKTIQDYASQFCCSNIYITDFYDDIHYLHKFDKLSSDISIIIRFDNIYDIIKFIKIVKKYKDVMIQYIFNDKQNYIIYASYLYVKSLNKSQITSYNNSNINNFNYFEKYALSLCKV